MAAYAALLSLKYILEQLQHHPHPPMSINQIHVQSFIQNITFLQDFLEGYSPRNEELDCLQSRIVEAAYVAEDVIESHIVDQILPQSITFEERISGSTAALYHGLQKVIQDMDLIRKEVAEIQEKMGSGEDILQHNRSSIPTVASFGSSSTLMNTVVGLDDVIEETMDKLTRRRLDRQIIAVVGMGGIGKTTLARKVYENPVIMEHFDIRAWTTISQEYSVKDILSQLLGQGSLGSVSQTSEEELGERLYKSLWGRRYLIIIDDMWDVEAWDMIKLFLPHNNIGSGIIITSRLSNLALQIYGACGLEMSFLNQDKSWTLLRKIVFGADDCPPELDEIGKKIAKNCKGLPLSIVVVGGLLAKSKQTREFWKNIGENLDSIVNLEDNERCLNLLYMSYNYLSIHLKPCFLYMGVFSEDDAIFASELIKLWVAEGILKPISSKSLEEVAEEYLKALVDRNLILVDKRKRNGKIKICKMHDLLRDLCLRIAAKDKFLCVTRLQNLNNFPQGTNTQRRIAIHGRSTSKENKYYLTQIRHALQSGPVLARSLICNSLKIIPSSNFRLSRVLIMFQKYIEEYSLEVMFQPVNARCLILRSVSTPINRKIPSSVFLLWNLQTLILKSISVHEIELSFEIWKMPQLRHVKVDKLYLPDPKQDDFILGNLETLSCTLDFKYDEEVVKRIPNIKKLKISYYDTFAGSHCCLNNLGRLHKLESIKCCFFPWGKRIWTDLVKNLPFPHLLKKLTLMGSHLRWEDMSTKIGSLPLLQVLKLGLDAFIGPEWDTDEGQFCSLTFLEIDFCPELECWTTDSTHFPRLEHLVLKNFHKLKEIPWSIGEISMLRLIEVEDCNNSVVISAKKIAEEQEELGNKDLRIVVKLWSKDEAVQSLASRNFQVQ